MQVLNPIEVTLRKETNMNQNYSESQRVAAETLLGK